MGIFSKLFKGPEIDMEKSGANAKKMRALFNQVVENGDDYRLIFGYTEDVSRFNYGFVHGSKTKIGNLIVGWLFPRSPSFPGAAILSITAAVKFSRHTEINTQPTHSSFILTKKVISVSTLTIGWRMNGSMSMYPRRRNWRPLPTFL